jgi:hypothetical protein
MIKNWKVALGLGVGLWAIMFIGVSAIMVTPLPDIAQKILEIILSGVAAFILAKIYFSKNPGDIKAGLILGVFWFVVEGILDLLVTVQYVKAGGTYLSGLKAFYSMWNLWLGFLLMFVGVVLAAKLTRGGELMKKPPTQQPPTQPPVAPPTPPTPPTSSQA